MRFLFSITPLSPTCNTRNRKCPDGHTCYSTGLDVNNVMTNITDTTDTQDYIKTLNNNNSNFDKNTRNRARPRTYSKLWSA